MPVVRPDDRCREIRASASSQTGHRRSPPRRPSLRWAATRQRHGHTRPSRPLALLLLDCAVLAAGSRQPSTVPTALPTTASPTATPTMGPTAAPVSPTPSSSPTVAPTITPCVHAVHDADSSGNASMRLCHLRILDPALAHSCLSSTAAAAVPPPSACSQHDSPRLHLQPHGAVRRHGNEDTSRVPANQPVSTPRQPATRGVHTCHAHITQPLPPPPPRFGSPLKYR